MTRAATRSLEPPASIGTQYETLRRAALGEGLPPEARSGLALFLRRGMWGWARATAINTASVHPARLPAMNSTAREPSRAAIYIFAALAIRADNGGATR